MSTEFARTDVAPPGFTAPAEDQPTVQPADVTAPPAVPKVRWNPLTKIAFRFTALYLALYNALFSQMYSGTFGLLFEQLPSSLSFRSPELWPPVQAMMYHIAQKWWGYTEPVQGWHQGAETNLYDWALNYGVLLIAAALTVVWSAVDWKRPNYTRVQAWLRLLLRVAVGGQMIGYGFAKAFPTQMPFPSPTQLLTPYGYFNLMAVLWGQMGSSPAYQIFTGCAEVAAGILLLIPGFTTIAALVGIAVTGQVWILNMTFDVPVKNLSMHLMIMCVVLLIPDLRKLVNLFVFQRPTDLRRDERLFTNRRAQWVAIGLQLVLAFYLIVWPGGFFAAKAQWARHPANQPKPPLYGIWMVEKMWVNGEERPPLLTDRDRWRYIIIERPYSITFQRVNGANLATPARVDLDAKTIKFTNDVPNPFVRPGAPKPPLKESGEFVFDQKPPDGMILEGTFEGKQIRVETRWWNPVLIPLARAKFRWVQ